MCRWLKEVWPTVGFRGHKTVTCQAQIQPEPSSCSWDDMTQALCTWRCWPCFGCWVASLSLSFSHIATWKQEIPNLWNRCDQTRVRTRTPCPASQELNHSTSAARLDPCHWPTFCDMALIMVIDLHLKIFEVQCLCPKVFCVIRMVTPYNVYFCCFVIICPIQ